MEGLIPYLMHAMRKQRPQHSYRCLSDASNRSYHLLTGSDSHDGSSHRRTRSEFLPPASASMMEFSEQRSAFESPRGLNRASVASTSTTTGSSFAGKSYGSTKNFNNISDLRHRR
ncbi:uncharacterized protein LOC116203817 [Punica granatum]|uniref:Uncharacterized protein n=2 Tax=Punica granatum TaxID=22663 RepID=A0A218VWK2_PUNGR|nr:uncharacterized protein LOC116203817 [Punica granatum]OWM64786.1 hypothetical protein CDL15_Pgr028503 [Punica granatum]PKI71632.1 hypothetical protein CRG98_007955 [Punica granatum]